MTGGLAVAVGIVVALLRGMYISQDKGADLSGAIGTPRGKLDFGIGDQGSAFGEEATQGWDSRRTEEFFEKSRREIEAYYQTTEGVRRGQERLELARQIVRELDAQNQVSLAKRIPPGQREGRATIEIVEELLRASSADEAWKQSEDLLHRGELEPAAYAYLRQVLVRSLSEFVRGPILRLLADDPSDDTTELLLRIAEGKAGLHERAWAMASLRGRDGASVTRLLEVWRRERSGLVGAEAARTLAFNSQFFGLPYAHELPIRDYARRDGDLAFQRLALEVIPKRGDEYVGELQYLAKVPGSTDDEWRIRAGALLRLAALAESGNEPALATVLGGLKDPSASVRCQLLEALQVSLDRLPDPMRLGLLDAVHAARTRETNAECLKLANELVARGRGTR